MPCSEPLVLDAIAGSRAHEARSSLSVGPQEDRRYQRRRGKAIRAVIDPLNDDGGARN